MAAGRCNVPNCLSMSAWVLHACASAVTSGGAFYVFGLLKGSKDAIGVLDEISSVQTLAPTAYLGFAQVCISYGISYHMAYHIHVYRSAGTGMCAAVDMYCPGAADWRRCDFRSCLLLRW